jgi:hypothetical protein
VVSTLDTYEDAKAESSRPVPVRPYLFLVLECDRPHAGGARYALDGAACVKIGRGERREVLGAGVSRAALRLAVPGRSMSSIHAELRLAGGSWTIEDCGSTNGTFVNGERVRSAPLSDGDLIEIGHTFFTLKLAVPTPAGTQLEYDPALVDAGDPFATLLPWLHVAFKRTQAAALTPLTVVVTGGTGSGKELVARAVHALSGRSGDLVAVNCAALVPTLVERLLFGHVKGSFSGAVRDELGFVRAARRGTLFLDEIADLPLNVQAMLLRVLQEGEVVPVGAAQPVRVDVRVVAASQRPLAELVESGAFLPDLCARLAGFELGLPSLAERRVDLGIVIRAILARMGGEPITLSREAGRAIFTHPWPQNIRELEQALRHAIALSEASVLRLRDLPDAIRGSATSSVPPPMAAGARGLSDEDRQARDDLIAKLREHRGNVSGVARAMGKARIQVQRWLRRFGIDAADFK